jgi:predicted transcriptional regulator
MATIDEIPSRLTERSQPASELVPISLTKDGNVFDVLSSQSARELVTTLAESPAPASELATTLDTSLQNAQYHLDRLQSAGLVTVVGQKYSSRGREMTLYGLVGSSWIVIAGRNNVDTVIDDAGELRGSHSASE